MNSDVSMLRNFADHLREIVRQRIGEKSDDLRISLNHEITTWPWLRSEDAYQESVRLYISIHGNKDSWSFTAGNCDAMEREFLKTGMEKILRWFGAAPVVQREVIKEPLGFFSRMISK